MTEHDFKNVTDEQLAETISRIEQGIREVESGVWERTESGGGNQHTAAEEHKLSDLKQHLAQLQQEQQLRQKGVDQPFDHLSDDELAQRLNLAAQLLESIHQGQADPPPDASYQIYEIRLALATLTTAADRYLQWNDQRWTYQRDHEEWQRLKDAIDAARAALSK